VVWHNEILMMSLARSKADQCSYSPSAGNMPDRRPVLADAMCIYFLLWWLGRKSTWCSTLMRTFRRVFLVKKLDDFSTHTHTHHTLAPSTASQTRLSLLLRKKRVGEAVFAEPSSINRWKGVMCTTSIHPSHNNFH